jgi:hypothetical protein
LAVYLIGYDLHEGQDYSDLEEAIRNIGTWWHCLDSTWLVVSDRTAASIRDGLLNHIRSDDKLLVMLYGGVAAWYGFTGNCQDWLTNNL